MVIRYGMKTDMAKCILDGHRQKRALNFERFVALRGGEAGN